MPGLPDLLSLIPEGNAKAILQYAFRDLQLSSSEAEEALYDANRLCHAINLLLSGGVLAPADASNQRSI